MSKAVSSNSVSFYDWELSFKNKSDKDIEKESFNSLGLSDNSFKNFIEEWKDKNLS